MLELNDLREIAEIQKIKELILPNEEGFYEIYVPKETQLFASEREAISQDYAQLAFAGQMLKDISEDFDYEVVLPQDHESILFTLKVKNGEELAKVLLELTYYYGFNENEDEDVDEFEYSFMNIEQYMSDVNEEKITPACPEFVEISNEYMEEEDEEDKK